MSDLPQEVIDRFIDELSNSIEDLRNLSLVCRSWLRRARYHLFRSITLGPQDFKEIREHYADVKRKASRGGWDPDDRLSFDEEKLLRSPLAENPQPVQLFLSSISDTLPCVRGLRLIPFIQVGRGLFPAQDYFHKWLGFGGDLYVSECYVKRESSPNEDFYKRQKARWDAVDLPWGHRAGIHALPFRNLRYIHIHWSVFSWTPPSLSSEGDDVPISMSPTHWPGFQLAMLIKSNADTLDYVSIDEYPGFRLDQYTSTPNADGLLDLLAQNAPKLRSLSLGGLLRQFNPHIHITQPSDSSFFLSKDPPIYPSGEEVPNVSSDWAFPRNDPPLTNPRQSSLECLSLRGFDSESTLLIEDAFLNRGVFSATRIKYLALSAMPKDYNYMFLFSKLYQSLSHLTLDLDNSTLNLDLKFSLFPNLECVQLIIHTLYRARINLRNMVRSLSDNVSHLDGSIAAFHMVRLLHIALGPGVHPAIARQYLTAASIDEFLLNLVQHPPLGLSKSMGWTKLNMVTVDVSETILAKALPMTFATGCLKFGETDEWWHQPIYLR
ncbi:hypothetical protein GGU10DRAFT_352912 [Lentinula aff. detonsa]|uniref:F-box domain-containing protein n=1 Tax=Lentinula aff. detonsa TaxID=2804958 RepID=A0AA38KQV1_9AGAR|nr:hypothetical protein GGU10DRAFT_352912 [Lentinula aff. detonsa]